MVSNDLDIPVPRNREAEQALVGAVLLSKDAYIESREIVAASDFYDPQHELIWSTVEALADTGQAVDAMSVMLAIRESGRLSTLAGGAGYLHTLIELVPSTAAAAHYARVVHEIARSRRALQIHQRIGQALIEYPDDHEAQLSALARQALELEVLVDERTGSTPVPGLGSYDEFIDRPRDHIPPIVPGLLRRQDVMMVLAGEGGGKSTLTRQFCMCIASGTHPWFPDRVIQPRVTLHIDLENAEDLIAEESYELREKVRRYGWRGQNMHIWHRPQGLNLRDRKDAMLFERAVAETGAEVVTLGSLYKAFSRRGDSWDTAAEETREVFDRIRARYGCAFIIEHHMPKGDGGASYDRPQTAFGSQVWTAWASMGYIINRVGDNMWRLDRFRGERGVREMPLGLTRGGELAWSPIWDRDELQYGMWEELQAKQRKPRQYS